MHQPVPLRTQSQLHPLNRILQQWHLRAAVLNVCGLSEKKGAALLKAGYDIVCGQEGHGKEQDKGHWEHKARGRFFTGAAPPGQIDRVA